MRELAAKLTTSEAIIKHLQQNHVLEYLAQAMLPQLGRLKEEKAFNELSSKFADAGTFKYTFDVTSCDPSNPPHTQARSRHASQPSCACVTGR